MATKIEAAEPIVLCPVLAVAPYHFSKLPLPAVVGSREHPVEWGDYFQRRMAAAGFQGIEAINPGSSFVKARSLIGNTLLEHMIREQVHELGDGDPLEELSAFDGGLALFAGGVALLVPQCCGDLANLASWDEALAERPTTGILWIGHPQVEIAFEQEKVILKEGWEYPPAPDYLVEVTVPLDALQRALQEADVGAREVSLRAAADR